MNQLISLVILLALTLSCKTKPSMDTFPAHYPRLLYSGRTFEDNSGFRYLISSGASLKFRVYGNNCRVWMQNAAYPGDYNYYSLVIDGKHFPRVPIRSEEPAPIEIPFPDKREFHDVEICKETEPANGSIIITTIEGEGMGEFPFEQRKKIEFIGNSITAGMSADPSMVPCETGTPYDQHNAFNSYGATVARKLNLEFIITAVTGIGVYRNWATDSPVMGDLYENTFLTTHPEDPKWDFEMWKPDIVCINLGTNDFSDGDGVNPRLPFDSTKFVDNYIALIKIVNSHYPSAQIILLQHQMSGEHNRATFSKCLDAIKEKANVEIKNIRPISIFSFSPMNPTGCSGHPGLKEHAMMAEELAPVIEKLIVQ